MLIYTRQLQALLQNATSNYPEEANLIVGIRPAFPG